MSLTSKDSLTNEELGVTSSSERSEALQNEWNKQAASNVPVTVKKSGTGQQIGGATTLGSNEALRSAVESAGSGNIYRNMKTGEYTAYGNVSITLDKSTGDISFSAPSYVLNRDVTKNYLENLKTLSANYKQSPDYKYAITEDDSTNEYDTEQLIQMYQDDLNKSKESFKAIDNFERDVKNNIGITLNDTQAQTAINGNYNAVQPDVSDSTRVVLPKTEMANFFKGLETYQEVNGIATAEYKDLMENGYSREKMSDDDIITLQNQVINAVNNANADTDADEFAQNYAFATFLSESKPTAGFWRGVGDQLYQVLKLLETNVRDVSAVESLVLDGGDTENSLLPTQELTEDLENYRTRSAQLGISNVVLDVGDFVTTAAAIATGAGGVIKAVEKGAASASAKLLEKGVAKEAAKEAEGAAVKNAARVGAAEGAVEDVTKMYTGGAKATTESIAESAAKIYNGTMDESLAKAITNTDNILSGVKMATLANGAKTASNLFTVAAKVVGSKAATTTASFVADTVVSATLYDPELAREVIYGSDDPEKTAQEVNEQFLENGIFWAGGAIVGKALAKAGETVRGQAISHNVSRVMNQISTKAGDFRINMKMRVARVDSIEELVGHIQSKKNGENKAAILARDEALRQLKKNLVESGRVKWATKSNDEILAQLDEIRESEVAVRQAYNIFTKHARGAESFVRQWRNPILNPEFSTAYSDFAKAQGKLVTADSKAGFKATVKGGLSQEAVNCAASINRLAYVNNYERITRQTASKEERELSKSEKKILGKCDVERKWLNDNIKSYVGDNESLKAAVYAYSQYSAKASHAFMDIITSPMGPGGKVILEDPEELKSLRESGLFGKNGEDYAMANRVGDKDKDPFLDPKTQRITVGNSKFKPREFGTTKDFEDPLAVLNKRMVAYAYEADHRAIAVICADPKAAFKVSQEDMDFLANQKFDIDNIYKQNEKVLNAYIGNVMKGNFSTMFRDYSENAKKLANAEQTIERRAAKVEKAKTETPGKTTIANQKAYIADAPDDTVIAAVADKYKFDENGNIAVSEDEFNDWFKSLPKNTRVYINSEVKRVVGNYYHGKPSIITERGDTMGSGLYLTDSKKRANKYAGKDGTVSSVRFNNEKVLDLNENIPEEIVKIIDKNPEYKKKISTLTPSSTKFSLEDKDAAKEYVEKLRKDYQKGLSAAEPSVKKTKKGFIVTYAGEPDYTKIKGADLFKKLNTEEVQGVIMDSGYDGARKIAIGGDSEVVIYRGKIDESLDLSNDAYKNFQEYLRISDDAAPNIAHSIAANDKDIRESKEISDFVNEQRKQDIVAQRESELAQAKEDYDALVKELKESKLTKEDIYTAIDKQVDDLVDSIYDDKSLSKEGLDALMRKAGESDEIAQAYLALKMLVESEGRAEFKSTLESSCRDAYLDVYKDTKIKGKDVDKVAKMMANMVKSRIKTKMEFYQTKLVNRGSKLVDREMLDKEIQEEMDTIEKEFSGKSVLGKVNERRSQIKDELGGDAKNIIHIGFDENGGLTRVIVPSTIRDAIERVPAQDIPSGVEGWLYFSSKLFRANVTGMNLKSWIRQPIRDVGSAFTGSGGMMWGNSFLRKGELMGEDAVNEIEAAVVSANNPGSPFNENQWNIFKEEAYAEASAPGVTETQSRRNTKYAYTLGSTNEKIKRSVTQRMGDKIDDIMRKETIGNTPLPNLAHLNEWREQKFRLGTYRNGFAKARRMGYTLEQSRVIAEDLMNNAMTNFAWQNYHLQRFQKTIPYLGAAVNGTKSFWHLASLDPVGVFGRMLGGICAPTAFLVGQSLANEENRKVYQNIPEYEKKDNLVFVVDGQKITIPLPQEMAAFFGLTRTFTETAYNANDGSFWQLMTNNLVSLSPIDLTGFTQEDAKTTGDYGFWDRIGRGTSRLASQLLPPSIKGTLGALTGHDLYTGKKINTAYEYIDYETGETVYMDYNTTNAGKAMASALNAMGIDMTADTATAFLSGFFGSSEQSIVSWFGDLATKVISGEGLNIGEELGNLAQSEIQEASSVFTGEVYDKSKTAWTQTTSYLYDLKEELLNSDKYENLNEQIDTAYQEGNEDKLKQYRAELQDYVDEYRNKVKDAVDGLISKYGEDSFTSRKYAAVVSLMNLKEETGSTGTAYANELSEQTKQQGKAEAIASMYRLGFTSAQDSSILGYYATSKTGEAYFAFNHPVAILNARNTIFDQGDTHNAALSNILEVNNLTRSSMFGDTYQAIKNDSTKLKEYKSNWNKKVLNAIKSYVDRYGYQAVINSTQVQELLTDRLFGVNKYSMKSDLAKLFKED